jgi:hypothetical protein
MDNVKVQEAWNMATETLKRLCRTLDMISYFSQRGALIRWFDLTMDLRRNLYPFLDEAEYKEINNKLINLPKGWIMQRIENETGGRVNPKHYAAVHKELDEIYLICIKLMKEKGILMPMSKDPRLAVLNN